MNKKGKSAMTRINYATDDDDAAQSLINGQLRSPDAATWAALCAPGRAEQTWRVLHRMSDLTVGTLGDRKRYLEQMRRDKARGLVTVEDYEAAAAAYDEWKTRANHFRTTAEHYMRRAYAVIARERGEDLVEAYRQVVKILATAIVEHRDRTIGESYEPTDFDRLLWARLATVQVPTRDADTVIPAIDYVGHGSATSA